MSLHTNLYYKFKSIRLIGLFYKTLTNKTPFLKTTKDSKAIYDLYDNREQRLWETESNTCIFNNRVVKLSYKEMREHYLNYLYKQINPLISEKPIKILEVGCGNCINQTQLKKRYGDKIELYGFDISQKRIDIAKQYFKNELDTTNLFQASITEKTDFKDNYFDVVFSMHCLEQIPYNTESALKEMHRLTKNKLVLIEPVFENGNFTQRLYLYVSDHNRILLKTLQHLGYDIKKNESLNIQSNPLNQSSIILIDK